MRRSFLFTLVVSVLSILVVGGCRKSVRRPPVVAAATKPAASEDQIKPQKVVERIDAGAGVTVSKLDNGLVVIIKPVRTAPVVCVKAYVRAGGLYEREWLGAGISHLAEHLVAEDATHGDGDTKAAAKDDKVRNRVTEIGGQSNASTSLAWAQYYISASSSKTDQCIDLIADWMDNPQISDVAFRREHGVVQRELETGADDLRRQMWMSHSANVFGSHPGAVPIIGYKQPLSRLTAADVRAYVRRMYVPQNMVFCVVGDVDAGAVLKRICRAFAGLEAGRLPDLSLPEVKPLAGVRRVVRRHKDLTEAMETFSFQTIRLVHDDLYALDVLSYILTHGPASRLVQSVQREKKLVTSIRSYSWTPAWGRGEFAFTFRSAPQKADAAEKAILDELKSVVARGVTAEQLKRAKRQKVADYVYSQQTAEDIAATLATDYLSTADVAFSRIYTDRIQRVTLEQVQEVAKRYFTFDRMAITRMVPGKKQATTAAATQAATAKAETRFFELPGGLRVILHPSDAVGLVSMTFVKRGGLLWEKDKTNGLGALMTALSVKGAGKRSAEDIAKFFDSAGGGVTGNCGNNTFYWQATVLDDSFGEALEILADVIQKPTFSEKELEILRPQMISRVKKVDENWRSQLHKFFRSKFYFGRYRRLAVGDEKVLKSATTEQIRSYHKKTVRDTGRSSSVLAIYGNFDPAKARKRIEELFVPSKGFWKIGGNLPHHEEDKLFILKTTNKVAGIIVAVRGMKIRDEDRYPVTILDTIISGYHLPSGWLHDELRGKKLVYVVHAYNWPGADLEAGAFMVEAACQPEKVPEVVRIIEKNLRKAVTYKPTQREIDRAVNVILTAELLDNQSISALSMSAALDELYGFGYDFRKKLEQRYGKVTPEDVQRVAKKYLTRPHVVVVTTPQPELAKKEIPKLFGKMSVSGPQSPTEGKER